MNKVIYTVGSCTALAPISRVFRMVLHGDTSDIVCPGQFVNVSSPGKYLRRPISICDWDENTLTLVFRVVGDGTDALSRMTPGQKVDCLVGLGNGFTDLNAQKPLLVGGGVGMPPMLALAKAFAAKGISPQVVGGFASKDDVILVDEFEKLGIRPLIATMDGSLGVKGTVMEIVGGLRFDRFYACGPRPMLKALAALDAPGFVSMEERMGCGFGICMGCSCKTADSKMKRVCKEGPVFAKEDIVW